MSHQTGRTALPQALRGLVEAAQAINAAVSRFAQTTEAPRLPEGVGAATGTAAAAVALTLGQRALCERVVNVFETGIVRGGYGAIAVFEDGPNGIRQITYGRSQTTEYGNLRELVQRYAEAGGTFSDRLRPYVPLIGRAALVDDASLKDLLRRAGDEDPAMQRVQDDFFDDRYFQPALRWAGENGFARALSVLVIYDSFIHSGRILDLLRSRFPEVPPARGGDEQTWVRQYVGARHAWLLGHHRPAVRASAYRTRDLAREIARGNWDLAQLPILANGVPVDDGGAGFGATPSAPLPFGDIPFLGKMEAAPGVVPEAEEIRGDEGRSPAGSSAVGEAFQSPGPQAAPGADRVVDIWGDDPFSEASPTAIPPVRQAMAVPLTGLFNPLLRVAIAEPQPPIASHPPGTAEFRYWIAAEALARGIAFWSGVLPRGTTWSAANPLPVRLVGPGDVLNAFYSRENGLEFFRGTAGAAHVFAAESADVVCHELGHAVLDALRPQLFHAALHEAAAFHEAFGDISAVLCALGLDWMRATVLKETGGRLGASSRLSRVAESLGWGIRQARPQAVEPDCLRNAANRLAYRRPDLLPTQAPASVLSRAPHSFSRVFTGAFLDALAGMFASSAPQDPQRLWEVGREAGRILVAAVRTAPIAAGYFAQVAAAMIQADQALHGGRYREALSLAFMRRGILSVPSALGLAEAPIPQLDQPPLPEIASAVDTGALHYADEEPDMAHQRGFGEIPELPQQPIALNGLHVSVHLPDGPPRFAVAPAAVGPASDEPLSDEAAGRLFLEELVREGRIMLPSPGLAILKGMMPEASDEPSPRVTHKLTAENDGTVLRRLRFQCCPCRRGTRAFTSAPETLSRT